MTPDLAGGLRDIRGLDESGWWLPAPGWWLLAAIMLVLLWLGWRWYRARAMRREHWRREAYQRLLELKRGRRELGAKAAAGQLSELLRRMALARCDRRDCAGLAGDRWLHWLHENDPRGFDWPRKGKLLKQLPYAPDDGDTDGRELRPLINAAIRWVVSEDPARRRRSGQRRRHRV